MGRAQHLLAPLLVLQLVLAAGCTLTDSRASLLVDGPAPAPDLQFDVGEIDFFLPDPDQQTPPPPDTGPVIADLGLCPAVCTNSCAGGICSLDCSKGCKCPNGYACQIDCKGDTCAGKIDCTEGISCNINCEKNACPDAIDCGPAACSINCSQGSCGGPILCGSGGCKVNCSSDSCHNLVRCEVGRCDLHCSDESCNGTVECSTACACSLTCSKSSCSGSNIKCRPLCKYGKSCTAKLSWCDKC